MPELYISFLWQFVWLWNISIIVILMFLCDHSQNKTFVNCHFHQVPDTNRFTVSLIHFSVSFEIYGIVQMGTIAHLFGRVRLKIWRKYGTKNYRVSANIEVSYTVIVCKIKSVKFKSGISNTYKWYYRCAILPFYHGYHQL